MFFGEDMSFSEFRHLVSQKEMNASDVMHCVLGLRSLEIDVYFNLLKGTATVKEIADGIGRNRSTIQRAIQNLVQRGFVKRRSRTLRKGGYIYVYEAVSLGAVKVLIKEALDSFYETLVKFLDKMAA